MANEYTFIDEEVSVDIYLPAVPKKDENIYLEEKSRKVLENLVKSDLKIAARYAPKWFYCGSHECTKPTNNELKDFSFIDASHVVGVAYYSDSEIIHVELDS